MSERTQAIKKKIKNGQTLQTITKTLKILSAINRTSYEKIVKSLEEYHRAIELGLIAVMINSPKNSFQIKKTAVKRIGAVFFGTDLGLVGHFNEELVQFALAQLKEIPGEKVIWPVGEILYHRLKEEQLQLMPFYHVPVSSDYILPLLTKLQTSIENEIETLDELYIFYNESPGFISFKPAVSRLLPIDEKWLNQYAGKRWPDNQIPELIDGTEETFFRLIKEYVFIEIYRTCAKSLYSENSARFIYMKVAEKNIEEHLQNLHLDYNRARRDSIDRELADIISGFEALS